MSQRRPDANKKNEKVASRVLRVLAAGGIRGQERVRNARLIPEETMIVLDKIMEYQSFFEGLEAVCGNVKVINPVIKVACTSTHSMYMLCESQKRCRDTFLSLMGEMDGILEYGVGELGSPLKTNPNVRAAFEAIVNAVKEISEFLEEQKRGTSSRFLRLGRDLSEIYESKLETMQDTLKTAKEGLRDSMKAEREKQEVLDALRMKLKSVSEANYSPGECCLEDTRTNLLTEVDTWIRGSSSEKTAWVYGHVGSGKSAIFNSIAENLEEAGIPFTCFPCKWDVPKLSDLYRILPTIAYRFASVYDDYRSTLNKIFEEYLPVVNYEVERQGDLLFQVSYDFKILKFSEETHQPVVHVILIDALDECGDPRYGDETVRERRALLEVLLHLAEAVPWIKVLITSRPEADFVDMFKDGAHAVRHIDIDCDKWSPTPAVMRHFLLITSEKLDLDLSHDQIERLRRKSSGHFIWYMMVFRYVKERYEYRRRIIESILEDPFPDVPHFTIYPLYQRVLDSAVSEAQEKELVESILGVIYITSTSQPLSATAITDILYPEEQGAELKEKKERVDNIIKSLSIILCVEEGKNTIRASHSTAFDFIVRVLGGNAPVANSEQWDDLIKSFLARLEEMHVRMFESCFAIMKRDLHFNICELDDSFQRDNDIPGLLDRLMQNTTEALRYSCLSWFFHLMQSGLRERGEQVFAFLNSKMALFWIEALSLMGAVDYGIVSLQDCASLFADEPNIVGIANEWERFLSEYKDTSMSTPHLYLSALSWIPSKSILWDVIRDSFSSVLPVISDAPTTWKTWSDNVGTWLSNVAYSSDGRLFAAGCETGIRIWNSVSRTERRPIMTESPVRTIAFSPREHWLASLQSDNNIHYWNLHADSDSTVSRVLEGHTDRVLSIDFSSDGRKIVSGSGDQSIRLWDVESGTTIGEPFRGHDDYVISVTFSADDTRIISSSFDDTVRIWDSMTGEQIGELLQSDLYHVSSVACSRDGKFIASCSFRGTIRLWDAQTYEQIGDMSGYAGRSVESVCFSPDSKYIVSGSRDYSVRVWNVETRSLMSELEGSTDRVTSIAVSPDGCSVISGSADGEVRIWDIKEAAPDDQPPAVSLAKISCISYVPGSNRIVSGSDNGNLNVWDAHTGAAVGMPMQGHTKAVNALAVSSDGLLLVSGSDDETLQMWDVASGAPIGEPMRGHAEKVNSVAFSPDNQLIASASSDGTVRLWDIATHESLKTLKGHEDRITSVTFSVDGNNVVSGSADETIRIWDTRTGEAVGQPLEHPNKVLAVAVSLDGQWIASASDDDTVRIWSMSTLSQINVLVDHSDSATSVSFSPDSQFLISGSHDKAVRVWNVQTGEAVGDSLKGHISIVRSVAFAFDSNEFASASDDGTIRVWDKYARTDLEMQEDDEKDYSELDEEALRIRWNSSRASADIDDAWIKDKDKLLLWMPWQYRRDITVGCRLIIGTWDSDTVRPRVDYQKMFRYSGARWKDIYTERGSGS